MIWTYANPTWLVGGVHGNAWTFYQVVVHHPDTWASVHGIFIFRSCMVRHLRFLLLLDSQPLSQMEYTRDRHVCCASNYLGIPGTLAWRIIGVTCTPFHWIPLPRCFVVGGLLRLCWAFLGTFAWRVPGLLWRVFLARFRRCLGGPYHNHFPPTCSPHCLGVLPFSGFSFFCAT